jgi:hypothetical protein
LEVTHWDGVPIYEAVSRRATAIGDPEDRGTRALALDSLTHDPLPWLQTRRKDGDRQVRIGASGVDVECTFRKQRRAVGRVSRGNHASRLLSIDVLADAIADARYSRRPELSLTPVPEHPDVGHLKIPTFDVNSVDEFVASVYRLANIAPHRGLVVDVRASVGGLIPAAERLLQLFTPRDQIKPTRLAFRVTPLTRSLVGKELQQWTSTMTETDALSGEFAVTGPELNAIGQAYHGPVVLLVDARTYGAADFLVAGFRRNRIGRILSTAPRVAAGLHNTWDMNALQATLARRSGPRVRETMTVSTRTPRNPEILEPDEIHTVTIDDVRDDGRGLLKHACRMLEGLPQRVLVVQPSVDNAGLSVQLTTLGFSRLEILVDGVLRWSGDAREGEWSLPIPDVGPEATTMEVRGCEAIEGAAAAAVVARRRLEIAHPHDPPSLD